MNADPAAQLRLLYLQATDTAVAQLNHRRATLPELAALAAADERAEALHMQVVELQTQLDDVAEDQRRLENEVEAVRTRTTRDEQRLATGGLPAKELESLQHEVTTLARRQSSLEDDLLEIMEQRETFETGIAGLAGQVADVDTERAELVGKRDDAFAEIDAAAASRAAQRSAIAAELPADLLALYEKIRTANSGVGAAMLRQRRCEGCRIELAGSELSVVRAAAPTLVVRCENCRRILVRTAESGL